MVVLVWEQDSSTVVTRSRPVLVISVVLAETVAHTETVIGLTGANATLGGG